MILALSLWQLLAHCAPRVGPITLGAVIFYESAGDPNAIHDNSTGRSYHLRSRHDAEALAERLFTRGDSLDVGYMQVNSANFSAYGLSAPDAFEPCVNVAVGADILRRAYARAVARYGAGQRALMHALSAYNTGSLLGGLGYAASVIRLAGAVRQMRGNTTAR